MTTFKMQYRGQRIDSKDILSAYWHDFRDDTDYFYGTSKIASNPVIGGIYEFTYSTEDEGRFFVKGENAPVLLERLSVPSDEADTLTARTRKAMIQREKRELNHKAIVELLQPLIKEMEWTRTTTQRTALIANVVDILYKGG